MASGPAKDNRGGDPTGPKELPFTAWGKQSGTTTTPATGDYTGACLPFGLMRSMNSPDPIQFIQHGPYLACCTSRTPGSNSSRLTAVRMRMLDPTWFGDSVGHWDGDTLVVQHQQLQRQDQAGHDRASAQRATGNHRAFHPPDLGHMSYEVTIHDPKTYTEDWGNKRVFTLRTDTQIMEYSCEENNKSLWEGRIKVPKYD